MAPRMVVATASLAACTAATSAGPARWDAVGDGLDDRVETRFADEAGSASGPCADALAVSSRRRVFLRFRALPWSRERRPARVLLRLEPHPGWRPSARPGLVLVRGVRSEWTVEGLSRGADVAVDEDPAATAELSAGRRQGLRLDLSSLARAWTEPEVTVALETDGPEAVFAGVWAPEALRPRLEVLLR